MSLGMVFSGKSLFYTDLKRCIPIYSKHSILQMRTQILTKESIYK